MSNVHPIVPDGPMLVVEVVDGDAEVVAHVIGDADLTTVGRLGDALEPSLASRRRVVLDLSG